MLGVALRAQPAPDDALPGSLHALVALFASSCAWALGIALVAMLLALPIALALRRAPFAWALPLLVPLLLPNYLVSFCLTLLVQPQSALGAWIATYGQSQLPWLPGLVMQGLAFIGLAAWLAPLGVLLLLPACKALPESCVQSLRLDAPPLQRGLVLLRMLRGPALLSLAVLGMLMLGSAVPLHLTNAPTLSVRAWASAMLSPASLAPWSASAPVLLLALCTGAALALLAATHAPHAAQHTHDDASARAAHARHTLRQALRTPPTLLVLVVPLLLVALPLLAAMLNVRSVHSIVAFAQVASQAIASSLLVGACTGALLAGVLMLALRMGQRLPRAGVVALAMLLCWALVPGVLSGQAWTLLIALVQERAPLAGSDALAFVTLVLAHASRFAGFFALAGVVLASLESRDLQHARMLDAATSTKGWLLTRALGSVHAPLPVVVGAFSAGLCLSLHEIESTIMLQPPGTGSLGQTMLANLHFARSEELCAGVLVVSLLACGALVLPAWLLWMVHSLRRAARAERT